MKPATPFIPGPREYRVDVAGDSTQQASLAALVGRRRQERLHIHVRARLAPQDDIVTVSIEGHQVGHLPARAAQALDRIVRYGERSPHEAFECAALIHGTAGQLGVRLDLPIGED